MPARNGSAHAPRDLRTLLERLPFVRFRAEIDESVYAEGDEDDSLYLIESGQVKLFMSSAGGRECIIDVYAAGDAFGDSCFATSRRFESATAMLPTRLRRIARRDIIAEVDRVPSVAELVLRHCSSRTNERQVALVESNTLIARQRLVKILLRLAERIGASEGEFLRLDITHEELSHIVGTTRPRVSEFIDDFRKEGLVESPGPRSIRVHRTRVAALLPPT